MKSNSKIAILLTAYNGEAWIFDQIESILNQKKVSVDLYVSIDLSTDNTYKIIEELQLINKNIKILSYGDRYGGAAKNFYRLIKDVDISKYDYVAFSDQDDIWFPEKLIRGINKMQLCDLDAYSSDVIAFWSNGRKKLIKKSYPQKKYDFIFESAGPGCTYILKSSILVEFKLFLIKNWYQTNEIDLHDWLIYAYCRVNRYKWFIDNYAGMLYRQHGSNQFGANVSLRSYLTRLSLIKNGWYFNEVFKISKLLKISTLSNSFVFKNFLQLRRNKKDSVIVLFFYLLKH